MTSMTSEKGEEMIGVDPKKFATFYWNETKKTYKSNSFPDLPLRNYKRALQAIEQSIDKWTEHIDVDNPTCEDLHIVIKRCGLCDYFECDLCPLTSNVFDQDDYDVASCYTRNPYKVIYDALSFRLDGMYVEPEFRGIAKEELFERVREYKEELVPYLKKLKVEFERKIKKEEAKSV